ncbi:phage tail length tape measure family protein [Pseudomonas sp. QLc11A]|uniref:Phage tail length tape measure family protein n=1 Tax=Pseudomonas azerbaijanorientalis TaxID=2842350 RepID=A0ABW8W5R8_9PSED
MAQTSRLVIELDSRDAEAKAADTRKALEALEDAGLSIQPALNKAGAGMETMGKSAEKATKSIENEADELERLLGQIDPVTRRLGELDKQEQELAKHRNAAGSKLDKATYDEYQAKINQARAGLTRFDDSLTRTGITAKQTAAALRGVPAQFTDIATSLQGGQAPLTVLLQQGGQLKDMFGGVGPAAKALSGYVAGLINPFTLAGAAVAGFTLAAYKGYEQAEQYRKTLTQTGGAAGRTADDLIAMSNAIAGGRNFEEASQAVLALAENGRLTGEAFAEVARAATEMSVATGKSVGDIADQLSSTKGSVTDLAAEYSDKYGVITQAVFDQVRSLEQQGDKMEAVRVLAGAVADEMGKRNTEMVESTRGLARAWDGVKTSISGAWNELKAGLSASPEMFKLQHLQGQLQDAQELGDKALIAGLEKQVALAQQVVDAKTQAAEKTSAELQDRKATITADKAWFEDGLKYRTNQQKMEKDIADARAKGLAAKVSEADIEQRIGQIRDEYASKEKKPTAPKAYTEDAGMKVLAAARQTNAVLTQQLASINGQGIATEKVGAQAQALIKWEQQLADIKGKKTLTADQKSLLASQDLITAQLKKNAGLEREAEIQRGIKQASDDQVKLLTLTGQLREANRLKSSLDDAAQMAEYERQGNTEAAKRLETLIKIRDINLNAAQKPGTIEGVTKAPTATGLDPSIGGADSEITRLNEESARLDQWRATELEKQKAYLDLKAINEETYAERVANINNQAAENRAKIEQAKNTAIINQSSSFFGIMATLSQSGHSKLAAIGKATAMAQATIDGYLAIQKALAAFPPPFNFIAAGVVGVATAANVANIAGVGFSNGGYTGAGGVNDPAGTVHKGEIVWSQSDIRKFGGVASVEALRNGNVSAGRSASGGSGSSASASNGVPAPERPLTFNLIEDASRAGQVSRRQLGEQDVIDICVANIRGEKELHQVNQEKYGLQSQGT